MSKPYSILKRKPTRLEVLNTLVLFGTKNPAFNKLIKTFDLVDEIGIINNININLKHQEKMAKTEKYKTEIEGASYEKIPFLKLDEIGDTIEGNFIGHNMIDFKKGKGDEKIYKIEKDGECFYLPSNAQLSSKLANLEKIMKEGEADCCEIKIEFTGWLKLDGGKKAKQISVKTA